MFLVEWWDNYTSPKAFTLGRKSARNECFIGINEGQGITKQSFCEGKHEWDLTVLGLIQPTESPKYPRRHGIGIVCLQDNFTNLQKPMR